MAAAVAVARRPEAPAEVVEQVLAVQEEVLPDLRVGARRQPEAWRRLVLLVALLRLHPPLPLLPLLPLRRRAITVYRYPQTDPRGQRSRFNSGRKERLR